MSLNRLSALSSLWLVLSAIGLMRSPAAAQLSCGGTLAAGSYQMTEDISDCASDPALTLQSGAVLDMNAHKITCQTTATNGVVLSGDGSSVANGRISNCAIGLSLGGNGGHIATNLAILANGGDGLQATGRGNKLTDVHASGNGGHQINLLSDGNKLSHCNASNGTAAGIHIQGNGNKISNTTANNNDGSHGFYVENGNSNQFKGCIAAGNKPDGFHVVGDGNKVSGCVATHSDDDGFSVEGNSNKVSKNTAVRNSYGFFTGNDLDCNQCVFSSNDSADNDTENYDGGGAQMAFTKNRSKGSKVGFSIGGDAMDFVDHTLAAKNRVLGADQLGIEVYDSTVEVTENLVVGSGQFDLQDDTASCSTNLWSSNVYSTRDQGCEQ